MKSALFMGSYLLGNASVLIDFSHRVLRTPAKKRAFSPFARAPSIASWYCVIVKNITVSLDEETYRRARVIAAERGTSVSALVKGFLTAVASGEDAVERMKREERTLRERIVTFRASDRLSRDDVHARGV